MIAQTGDMPNSRWYSGGGIYRDVALLTGGLVHVPDHGVRIVTNELDDRLAVLTLETDISNRLSRNLALAAANMDLVGYNYMTGRYIPDRTAYPSRVIAASSGLVSIHTNFNYGSLGY